MHLFHNNETFAFLKTMFHKEKHPGTFLSFQTVHFHNERINQNLGEKKTPALCETNATSRTEYPQKRTSFGMVRTCRRRIVEKSCPNRSKAVSLSIVSRARPESQHQQKGSKGTLFLYTGLPLFGKID